MAPGWLPPDTPARGRPLRLPGCQGEGGAVEVGGLPAEDGRAAPLPPTARAEPAAEDRLELEGPQAERRSRDGGSDRPPVARDAGPDPGPPPRRPRWRRDRDLAEVRAEGPAEQTRPVGRGAPGGGSADEDPVPGPGL